MMSSCLVWTKFHTMNDLGIFHAKTSISQHPNQPFPPLLDMLLYRYCIGTVESACQRTCEANAAGENSSFIFTGCIESAPLYHFKLACVVLQMTVKEFFETHF